MRRRTFAALGAGATASVATCALLTTGVVGTSIAILATPAFVPPAAAEPLQAFDDCEELREWYVDAAMPFVGPWGLGWPGYYGGPVVELDAAVAAEAAPTTRDAVGSGDTGTNVQEAGVDEPDVAKTDGRFVVHLDRRDLVVTDTAGGEAEELSRIRLPKQMWEPELLLVGDTVLVFGTTGYFGGGVVRDAIYPVYPGEGSTRLIAVDISDPASPRIEREERIDGSLVSAREYDGTVRAVVSTGAPQLDWVHPTPKRTHREARRENREVLRDSTIEDWLPSVRRGGESERLVDCTDVRHPEESSGFGTITVVTFPAEAPQDRSTTAVTTSGELVYSSLDRLYIATMTGGWGDPVPLGGREDHKPRPPATQVHAFALDGLRTEYVASGELPGTVRDRWSFSEYDGRLRVATALGQNSWSPRENAVVVLEERGDELVETGRVAGMGERENIQSVRWFGDLAVLVTFRQVDPLYTVDLSDPEDPRVVGELKIPGFSSYLHPVGDGLLLGLGQDATLRGMTRGAQAALFDVTDLSDPRRTDTVGFARHTETLVAWDSRAFTYLPDRRLALVPFQNYHRGDTKVVVLRMGDDGTLRRVATERVGGWNAYQVRTLPLDDGQVAIVNGDEVQLLSLG